MNSFVDYYAALGVTPAASSDAIKAAFKKLALQYHPDVYKGEDAHERMRELLQAYQTLNDPAARKQYDVQHAEHVRSGQRYYSANMPNTGGRSGATASRRAGSVVSPGARRDRQRHYDFPDFRAGQSVQIDLIDIAYTLSPSEARTLLEEGLLRGVAPQAADGNYYCHRCHHHWKPSSANSRTTQAGLPFFCPKCQAADWSEYLLLRCVHCCAVFESEQIRYEIGLHSYGKDHKGNGTGMCPPYELFPLCPYCGTARWCPAEDSRVQALRLQAAQQAALRRKIWLGIAIIFVITLGVMAFALLR
ncbi:MAG TPA: DnaJ domain-containing protein [Ktedonobacteraceae bacterium]|nr:DnaJ domain-containing protein [Ktedonobacteraceae bacterium]